MPGNAQGHQQPEPRPFIICHILSIHIKQVIQAANRVEHLQGPRFFLAQAQEVEADRLVSHPGGDPVAVEEGALADGQPFPTPPDHFLRLDDVGDDKIAELDQAKLRLLLNRPLLPHVRDVAEPHVLHLPDEGRLKIRPVTEVVDVARLAESGPRFAGGCDQVRAAPKPTLGIADGQGWEEGTPRRRLHLLDGDFHQRLLLGQLGAAVESSSDEIREVGVKPDVAGDGHGHPVVFQGPQDHGGILVQKAGQLGDGHAQVLDGGDQLLAAA